jgi:serine/threonine protein kinase
MSNGSAESSDFTIGEELGKGGFSLVCRGTFRGIEVAIKKVQIAQQKPQRAGREYENMRMLDHPNVLKLLDVKETSEIRFNLS